MNNGDRELILKDNYKQILKESKHIMLETEEHFLTVIQVMLEGVTDSSKDSVKRWKDALDYIDTFIKYRSSFVRELLELVNDK